MPILLLQLMRQLNHVQLNHVDLDDASDPAYTSRT